MIVTVAGVSLHASPFDVIRLVASATGADDVDIEPGLRGRVTISTSNIGSVSGESEEDACLKFIELSLKKNS